MLFDSPLREEHRAFAAQDAARRADRAQQARGAVVTRREVEVEYLPFGPADAEGAPTCEVVAAYAEVELEYAAIRGGVAIVDGPQRGTLEVRGADRADFVNRLVTQEVKKLADGAVARAFLTNRKGRIDADLVIARLPDAMLVDTLVHDVAALRDALEKMHFGEDIVLAPRADTHARLSLHGPKAESALKALGLARPADAACEAWTAPLGDARADIWTTRELGVPGFELSVPVAQAASLWRSLVTFGARPAGWFATNTARIEAGTPYFRIDFGPTNLPHESGVLESRVSFTKGCYPGQEVVARMQHLGKPKQRLVGLRIENDLLPVAEAQVFAVAEGTSLGDQVGIVTSSGIAPMLGAVPVAFAMVSSSSYAEGTKVLVNAEGEQASATVGALDFLGEHEKAGAP
ncbi:MAG: Aminomethyltransferase [Planctomycetota bacterium]|jgi:aminomethyltransferase